MLPSPGQLVELRRHRHVVLEIEPSLRPAPLGTHRLVAREEHLVHLVCVDEKADGEKTSIIWELEPAARVMEEAALPAPTAFDTPQQLDALLDAITWGAIASADVRRLTAPFRSAITLEDYQLEPLDRALRMPRVGLLLADDVGLGKTIEAGLIAQELILRNRVRTILIVCPADLRVQWKDQMQEKFGLDFRIIDRESLAELRKSRGIHVNPWTHYPRLIVSLDYLKRDRPFRLFRDTLPAPGEPILPRKYDLLIIDEAHHIAPSSRGGKYATDSLNTRVIRTLSPHFEHRLFLSATPHNGYTESFTALLEMLDPQRFARGTTPEDKSVQTVTVRRLKSEDGIRDRRDGTARFPTRVLSAIEVALTDDEREAHRRLQQYTSTHLPAAMTGRGVSHTVAQEFVAKFLKKRLFSSPRALEMSLETHADTLRRYAERDGRPVSERQLRRQLEDVDMSAGGEEEADEQVEEAFGLSAQAIGAISKAAWNELQWLQRWAETASHRPDSKATALIDFLQRTCRPGGVWNTERVLIFTEYRATQDWLLGLLSSAGLAAQGHLATLYGGMDEQTREEIKANFLAPVSTDNPVRILLATDAASEGIDLQKHCRHLIHYEIPWNPNRMEQRNGRIDRHGQPAPEVFIHHFAPAGIGEMETILSAEAALDSEMEFLYRAAVKVDRIREDLGKVGPVLASQVEDAMLGKRRHLDTAGAEQQAAKVSRSLRSDRDTREHIRKFMDDFEQTRRDLRLDPERVEQLVREGLLLANQPALIATHEPGVYELPHYQGSWKSVRQGVERRYGPQKQERRVVFDQALALDPFGHPRPDRLWLHLGHPLVQRCLRLLRAHLWAQATGGVTLSRVTARLLPASAGNHLAVIAHGRLLMLGGRGARLHEEVLAGGLRLVDGKVQRLTQSDTSELLALATERIPSDEMLATLQRMWDRLAPSVLSALEARSRDRAESLERFLAERSKIEADDLIAIYAELRASIERELDRDPAPLQLELWTPEEREQRDRDRAFLVQRLDAIPAEEAAERDRLTERYATVSPRLFPAAVTFLVPESLTVAMLAGGR